MSSDIIDLVCIWQVRLGYKDTSLLVGHSSKYLHLQSGPINIIHLTLSNSVCLRFSVGLSLAALSGLYTTAMKAAGASRRVFQLLDRVSHMPKAGDQIPLG